jgi:hypothetical protein
VEQAAEETSCRAEKAAKSRRFQLRIPQRKNRENRKEEQGREGFVETLKIGGKVSVRSCLTSLPFVTLETAINAITYVFATLAGHPLRHPKSRFQRRLQIGNQVVRVFNADRVADEGFGDAAGFALLGRGLHVAGGGGRAGDGFDRSSPHRCHETRRKSTGRGGEGETRGTQKQLRAYASAGAAATPALAQAIFLP